MTPEEELQRVELALGAAVNGLRAALADVPDLATAGDALDLASRELLEAQARRRGRRRKYHEDGY